MSNVQYTAPTLNDTGLSQFKKNLDAITNKMKIAGRQATSLAKQDLYMLKISAMLAGNDIVHFTNKIIKMNTSLLNIKTDSARNQIEKIKEKTKKFSTDLKGQLKDVAGKSVQFAKDSVNAAQKQVENEMKLSSALKQRTNATKGQVNSISKLISAQQANGVVSDEVQMAGAQQLATYAKNSNSIKTLIPTMNNLLVKQKGLNGTTEDASNVADLMGKGLMGQTGELKKAGIAFNESEEKVMKFGTEEERAAMLAKVINKNVGNANKEMANTDPGAIQNAKNLFLDMQESIGKVLLPYLSQFAKWFSKNQPTIKAMAVSVTKTIISACQKVYKVILQIFKYFKKNQNALIFIGIFVLSIVALVKALKVLKGVMTAIQIVGMLLNGTMTVSPLGWILLIIAAIIAIGVLLWKNWDTIKQKASELWANITQGFENLKSAVIEKVTSIIERAKELWNGLVEFLKHPIKTSINFFKSFNGEEGEKEGKGKEGKGKGKEGKGKDGNGKPGKGNLPLTRKALGTSYWQGGLTYINERGGEIVDLPNGSRIIPADKSEKLLSGKGISFGNIYITAKGVTASEVVNELVPKLKLQLANI